MTAHTARRLRKMAGKDEPKIVKPRATSFGDGPISDWHRKTLGYDMPAVDLDFLLVEYDRGMPCAVFDYKHSNAKQLDHLHPSMRAVRELCDRRPYDVPFFVVKYAEDCTEFYVTPTNGAAAGLMRQSYQLMSEEEFIGFQQRLRDVNQKWRVKA